MPKTTLQGWHNQLKVARNRSGSDWVISQQIQLSGSPESPGPQGAILINHRKQRFQRLQGAARGTAIPKAGATAKLGRGDQATSFPAECNPNQLFSEHLPEGVKF